MPDPEDARLKEALGDDFDSYMEFRAQKDLREKRAKAKEIARDMVSEGGKYYDQYNRLDTQLNAIWDKAQSEAKAAVGLVEEESGE